MSPRNRTLSVLLAGTACVAAAPQPLAQAIPQQPGQSEEGEEPRAAAGSDKTAIVVTGTRIRGARVVGDVIELEREAIVEAGQVDLGEAIRTLPQNFSGGQNPGIGSGAGLINSNVNSASSANLRGLGPDATLTLLNGHRLPYDSAFAGVDISAIPLAAVDRIEVVPDGASALYGSDAVAGVVNVVLRRDFEGVETSAQLGASTDGGYFRQQADIVGGTDWDGGGFFLAYDFANHSDIEAGQRSYAGALDPDITLFPSGERHAVTFSGHHDLAPGFEAGLDALYSRRSSVRVTGSPTLRQTADPVVESYTLAPSIKADLGASWQVSLLGVFGRDRTHYRTTFTRPGAPASITEGCFCNEVLSLELGAEGALFALPGGNARLALGAGLRNNSLDFTRSEGGNLIIAFDKTQRARFAYGEIFLPFVSAKNSVSGIDELSLSLAARHEHYPGLDSQTTPRIGLVYAPVEGLTLRGSWARSFKAPTLYQRFIPYQTIVLPAAIFGAGSAPETVFITSGGNPDVRSERARSWTAGFDFRPAALPGLHVSATWYDIRYRDRVVRPIAGSVVAGFSDPGYASLIDFSPDPAIFSDLIASSLFGLENFSGSPYDPANVVAFIDNRNRNVSVWAVEGIDARVAWDHELGNSRRLGLELAGSWLDSKQQLNADLPEVRLAGTIFNPPRYRARGLVRYETGRFRANATVNYIGALEDLRFGSSDRLSPSATLDLGLSYDVIGGAGGEAGLTLSLTVQNLFDDEPEVIGQTGPTDTPYDSTNYSPIGRFIAFGIRRRW